MTGAVCLAEKYFEENKDDLSSVLDPGERHPLIQIGTHSRGAIFVDGEWLRSEQLESRIDEISRSIEDSISAVTICAPPLLMTCGTENSPSSKPTA